MHERNGCEANKSLTGCIVTVIFGVCIALVGSIAGCGQPQYTDVAVQPVPQPSAPTPAPPEPAPAPPEPAQPTLGSPERELLEIHNIFRKAANLGTLAVNAKLMRAAQQHAYWMADNSTMSHTGKDRSTLMQRVSNERYVWSRVGENIAVGQHTPEAVMEAWMDSSGHRDNILDRRYREAGFGAAQSVENDRIYWCVVFAAPASQAEHDLVVERYLPVVISTPPGIEAEADVAK